MNQITDYEIMAPVGSRDSLAAALKAGAGSVYFGVEQLNMRSHSANHFTIDDLREIASTCKEHGVKSMSALPSRRTLDWRRMWGDFFAHSGRHPEAPLPRKRMRIPLVGSAAAGAAATSANDRPATASAANIPAKTLFISLAP